MTKKKGLLFLAKAAKKNTKNQALIHRFITFALFAKSWRSLRETRHI